MTSVSGFDKVKNSNPKADLNENCVIQPNYPRTPRTQRSPTPMSTSSGDPRPQVQVAEADDKNKRPGQRDVEQGDLDTEKQRYLPNPQGAGSNEENLDNEPDEYTRLLKFIDLEAKKEKHRRDDDGGDGGDQEMRRLWYMPWKKVPVRGTKARKVPQTWLETNMTKGLSNSEIDDRRACFGYNELERCVDQNLPNTPAETLIILANSPRVNPIVQFVGYFRGPILFGLRGLQHAPASLC